MFLVATTCLPLAWLSSTLRAEDTHASVTGASSLVANQGSSTAQNVS